MNRNRTPEPARNNYGFPLADAPAYLPREQARDIPLPITMEDEPTADMSKAVVTAIVILCILAFAAALSPAFWANF